MERNPFDYEPHTPFDDYKLAINAIPEIADTFKEMLISIVELDKKGILRIGKDLADADTLYIDPQKSVEERTREIIDMLHGIIDEPFIINNQSPIVVDFEEITELH